MQPPLVKFTDPIFDYLHTNKLSKMWEILILRSIPDLKIKLSDVKPNEYNDTALGVASYNFSKKKKARCQSQHRPILLPRRSNYITSI